MPGQFDDVEVTKKTLEYNAEHNELMISATLILPNAKYNVSKLNHVWQVGAMADGVQPTMHGKWLENYDSTEILDLTTTPREGLPLNNHQCVLITVIIIWNK